MAESSLRLLCTDPALGLTSLNPNCIFVQTYLRFANVDFTVEPNPYNIPSIPSTSEGKDTQLPILRHTVAKNPSAVIRGASAIIEYLKSKSVDLDAYIRLRGSEDDTRSVTLKEIRSEVVAYTSLIEEKLLPCLLYHWWVVEENYNITRIELFKKSPFYSRWFYAPLMRKQCTDHLKRMDVKDKKTAEDRANECLSALSVLLGNKTYFYGETPSSLDALVYGYLHCFMTPDLPDSTLKQLVLQYPNLSRFTTNITKTFTSPVEDSPRRTLNTQVSKKQPTKSEQENNKSQSVIFGRFLKVALGALSVYFAFLAQTIYKQVRKKDVFEHEVEQSYHFDDHYEALTD